MSCDRNARSTRGIGGWRAENDVLSYEMVRQMKRVGEGTRSWPTSPSCSTSKMASFAPNDRPGLGDDVDASKLMQFFSDRRDLTYSPDPICAHSRKGVSELLCNRTRDSLRLLSFQDLFSSPQF